jgi:hypothetical protein
MLPAGDVTGADYSALQAGQPTRGHAAVRPIRKHSTVPAGRSTLSSEACANARRGTASGPAGCTEPRKRASETHYLAVDMTTASSSVRRLDSPNTSHRVNDVTLIRRCASILSTDLPHPCNSTGFPLLALRSLSLLCRVLYGKAMKHTANHSGAHAPSHSCFSIHR